MSDRIFGKAKDDSADKASEEHPHFGHAGKKNTHVDDTPGDETAHAVSVQEAVTPQPEEPVEKTGRNLGHKVVHGDHEETEEEVEEPPKLDPDSKTPELDRYIRSLSNPDAIPTIDSLIDHGDEEYRKKVEHYVELISNEIHQNTDPGIFLSDDEKEVETAIGDCVNTVLEFHDWDLKKSEIDTIKKILKSDFLGLGPLDEFLADDSVSDIMVDGPNSVFVEIDGRIDRTKVRFRSENHLLNICQRIVSRVGRHVDKASPICDARLPDGSRVNVILPPLALKGPSLTIRKFKKDRLTLEKLIGLGTVDKRTAALLEILAACRVNLLITGGTGSGKTTMLNCLTKYISPRERIITCEDAAELQLQQPQVVTLETRPATTEGMGLVTMRELVRNCLRMRPDRIIVGEVRGPEAFDLLQAMNTGHDGSMGTFHANSPRDALFRLENMVAMASLNIPTSAIREQIASSLEIIVHTQRLRDGSRKVMNICEITGMESEIVLMQDLVSFEITGEDEDGKMLGQFVFSQLRPGFSEKIRHYGFEEDLLNVLDSEQWLA